MHKIAMLALCGTFLGGLSGTAHGASLTQAQLRTAQRVSDKIEAIERRAENLETRIQGVSSKIADLKEPAELTRCAPSDGDPNECKLPLDTATLTAIARNEAKIKEHLGPKLDALNGELKLLQSDLASLPPEVQEALLRRSKARLFRRLASVEGARKVLWAAILVPATPIVYVVDMFSEGNGLRWFWYQGGYMYDARSAVLSHACSHYTNAYRLSPETELPRDRKAREAICKKPRVSQ